GHLRVGAAAVARRAKSLLVRHLLSHLVRRRGRRRRRRASLGCAPRLLLCRCLLVGRLLGAFGCPPGGRRRANRGDLDLRKAAPMTRVAPVTRSLAVFADADLVPEHVCDDLRGNLHALWRDLRIAVAADEEHRRVKELALLVWEPIDEQALTLLDTVLLPSERDDRVHAHS